MNGIATDMAGDADEKSRATNLPRDYYVSEAIFQEELRKIFQRQWLTVGHIGLLPNPGDFYVKQVGPESMIFIRDDTGRIRAYFNVCRHRGYRIMDDGAAGCARGFVCPYHHWTYDLDGKLRKVPGTTDRRHFPFDAFPLHEAICETWHGFIYVWMGKETPPPLAEVLGPITNEAAMQVCQPERMKLAHREIYLLDSNWKAMMENDMECYHCGHGGHPSLAIACNYQGFYADDGGPSALAQQQQQERQHFPLRGGMKSFSMNGERVCAKPLGTAEDGFSAGFILWPMFCGPVMFVDHAVSLELTPLSVGRSHFVCEWYVHEDAVEGVDYQLDKLIAVFDVTNREDKAFGERNYRGMQSSRFEPGPLHPLREDGVIMAYDAYRAMMAAD